MKFFGKTPDGPSFIINERTLKALEGTDSKAAKRAQDTVASEFSKLALTTAKDVREAYKRNRIKPDDETRSSEVSTLLLGLDAPKTLWVARQSNTVLEKHDYFSSERVQKLVVALAAVPTEYKAAAERNIAAALSHNEDGYYSVGRAIAAAHFTRLHPQADSATLQAWEKMSLSTQEELLQSPQVFAFEAPVLVALMQRLGDLGYGHSQHIAVFVEAAQAVNALPHARDLFKAYITLLGSKFMSQISDWQRATYSKVGASTFASAMQGKSPADIKQYATTHASLFAQLQSVDVPMAAIIEIFQRVPASDCRSLVEKVAHITTTLGQKNYVSKGPFAHMLLSWLSATTPDRYDDISAVLEKTSKTDKWSSYPDVTKPCKRAMAFEQLVTGPLRGLDLVDMGGAIESAYHNGASVQACKDMLSLPVFSRGHLADLHYAYGPTSRRDGIGTRVPEFTAAQLSAGAADELYKQVRAVANAVQLSSGNLALEAVLATSVNDRHDLAAELAVAVDRLHANGTIGGKNWQSHHRDPLLYARMLVAADAIQGLQAWGKRLTWEEILSKLPLNQDHGFQQASPQQIVDKLFDIPAGARSTPAVAPNAATARPVAANPAAAVTDLSAVEPTAAQVQVKEPTPVALERKPIVLRVGHDRPLPERRRLVATEAQKELAEDLRLMVISRSPGLIEGPAGSGKTAAVRQLATDDGVPYLRMGMHRDIRVADLFGRHVVDGVGAVKWQDGPVTHAMRVGGYVVLDELDLADAGVLVAVNGIIDKNSVPKHNYGGVPFKTHTNFRLFATANGAGELGREALSPDLLSRFVKVVVDSPTADAMLQILCDEYAAYTTRAVPVAALKQLVTAHVALTQLLKTFHDDALLGPASVSLRELLRVAKRIALFGEDVDAMRVTGSQARKVYLQLLGNDARIARVFNQHLPRTESTADASRWAANDKGFLLGNFLVPFHGRFNLKNTLNVPLTNAQREAMINVLEAYHAREPVVLYGERGGGKTMLAELVAQVLDKDFVHMRCHEAMTTREILGAHTLTGWEDGPLVEAAKRGAVLLADEMNTLPVQQMDAFNPALDGEKYLLVGQNNNAQVDLDGLVFVAAVNPAQYAARNELSSAMQSRLTVVRLGTPDSFEALAPMARNRLATTGVADASAQSAIAASLVGLHQWVQAQYANRALGAQLDFEQLPDFSPRQMLQAANMLGAQCACGTSPQAAYLAACKTVYSKRAGDSEDRDKIIYRIERQAAGLSRAPSPRRGTVAVEGGSYEGMLLEQVPHGHGVLTYDDGKIYEGAFVMGVRTGQGVETYPGTGSYNGAFVDGVRMGQGTYKNNGETYEGVWKETLQQGMVRYANGDVCSGAFRDGKPFGEVRITYAEGTELLAHFNASGSVQPTDQVTLPDGTVQPMQAVKQERQ